jgi:UDP-glucose 4-epimerase
MKNKTILVTGGAGYIGSHICVELLEKGYRVIVLDNYSNSSKEVIGKIKKITGKEIQVYEADVRDKQALKKIFSENNIDAIIHFAGLKAVGESVQKPLKYYDNNVCGSLVLLDQAQSAGCKTLIFSSSATVYGNPEKLPITEDLPVGNVTNAYGGSKLMVENVLNDVYISDNQWKIGILRYFNPVGAHKSGEIGENPNGIPNNLMPYIAQVAIGKLSQLKVFGGDYDTPDGTGVRDYIHVVDLAKGHIKSLDYLFKQIKGEVLVVNLGTGKGYSVLEITKAFEQISGKKINFEIVARRAGDIALCYADVQKAQDKLGWSAQLNIDDMCADTWRFVSNLK